MTPGLSYEQGRELDKYSEDTRWDGGKNNARCDTSVSLSRGRNCTQEKR